MALGVGAQLHSGWYFQNSYLGLPRIMNFYHVGTRPTCKVEVFNNFEFGVTGGAGVYPGAFLGRPRRFLQPQTAFTR